MLAVQALKENERAAVVQHVQECLECRAYAERLHAVVGLYTRDAERPIAPPQVPVRRLAVEQIPWYQRLFTSPAPALAAAAILVICAALLLKRTHVPDIAPVVQTATLKPESPMVPSIGNSRHLASADLEELSPPKPIRSAPRTELVFSVKTRDDGS